MPGLRQLDTPERRQSCQTDKGRCREMRTLSHPLETIEAKTPSFAVIFDVRASATTRGSDGDIMLTPDLIDKLIEHGCSDATFGRRQGAFYADFDREANSLPDAVMSAIEDLESTGEVFVLRVEPEDMVNAATIAARLGKSREGVRLWASGARGPGDFPEPRFYLGEGFHPIWTWSSVVAWHAKYTGALNAEAVEDATFLAYVNAVLEFRRFSRRFTPDQLGERPRGVIERLVSDAIRR